MEAAVNAFVGTDGEGQLTQQQITALGMDLIECPAHLEAMEHVRSDPGTTPQIAWFVGKKLGGERSWSLGKPQAMKDHPSHRFAWRNVRLAGGYQARVNHIDQA